MSSESAKSSQTLSHSPSKWIEEIEANPSLLIQSAASAIICRGLLHASTPILQKRLWQIVKNNTTQMLSSGPGCEILAALVRTGTVKTAAGVMRAALESEEFKAASSSSSNTAAAAAVAASPSKTTTGKKNSKAAAAATSSVASPSVSVRVNLEMIENIAPIISATAYRIDVQPERNDLLRPAVDVLIASLQQFSSLQSNSAVSLPVEGGLVGMLLALLGEKEGEIGASLVAKLVDSSSLAVWTNHLVNLSVNCAKRDDNALKTISKMISAAQESAVPARNQEQRSEAAQQKFAERATAIANLFWSGVKKAKSSEPTSIRIPFLTAVVPREKNNAVTNDVAVFVTEKRPDVVSAALQSSHAAKSELVTLLLNHAKDDVAKNLASAVIKAVANWTELISNAQLPQATLSCFLALRQITQKVPSLVVSPAMATVIDAATRHFLKQTLSAAESAKMAVKLRLSTSTNTTSEKLQMLKVVDSDDETEEKEEAAKAGNRRQRTASATTAATKPVPKNSAAASPAKKTVKK